jgi:small subunit ribosomal protein S17
MPKRKLKGTVVSNKMEKTIIVAVDKFKEHPKYKKRYKSTRR